MSLSRRASGARTQARPRLYLKAIRSPFRLRLGPNGSATVTGSESAVLVRPGSCHGVEIHELARVLNHRVPFRRAKSRVRILERLERQLTQTSIRRLRSIGARSANVLHVTRDAWDLPYQGNVVGAPPPQGFIRFEACSRNPLGQALHHRQASLSVQTRLVVPELPLVALRAVDNYLVVNRQPGCPAGDRADNAETLATGSSGSGERARTSRDLRLVRLEGAQHLLLLTRRHVEVFERVGKHCRDLIEVRRRELQI